MKSTDLSKKLRFDTSKKALVLNASMEYSNLFSGMCETKRNSKIQYDFIQVFATTQRELEKSKVISNAIRFGRR